MKKQVEENIPNKNKPRTWWKYAIMFILVLLFSLLIIIPHYYSNHLFRPIITKGFNEITKDKYLLDFENINWSIFKNSFRINDIELELNQSDTLKYSYPKGFKGLKLNSIELKGLDYLSFFRGEIKLKYLGLDSLFIDINQTESVDTSTLEKRITPFISEVLSSIEIKEVKIDQACILVQREDDSLFLFQDLSLAIDELLLDSLNTFLPIRIPKFNQLILKFDRLRSYGQYQTSEVVDFSFATGQDLKDPELNIGKLSTVNQNNGNRILISKANVSLDLPSVSEMIRSEQIQSKQAQIHIHSLYNTVKKKSTLDLEQIIGQIQESLMKTKINIDILDFQLQLDTIVNSGIQNKLQIFNLYYQLAAIQIDSNHFDYSHFILQSGPLEHISYDKYDSLYLQSISFDERKTNLKIESIYYRMDSIESVVISAKEAQIQAVDWKKAISKNSIQAETILIDHPVVLVKNELQKKDNKPNKRLFDVDVHRIELARLNMNYQPLGLEVNNCDIKIDTLFILAKTSADWYDLFNNIDADFENLSLNIPNKKHSIQLENTQLSSSKGRINSALIQFKLEQDSRTISLDVEGKGLLIDGLQWKKMFLNEMPLMLDSLIIDDLWVDGHLIGIPKDQENKTDLSLYMECNYLSLPKIRSKLKIQSDKKYAYLELDQLSVFADSLLFDSEEPGLLHYKQLNLESLKSSYWQSQDSLILNLSAWNYNMETKLFDADYIQLDFLTTDTIKRTNVKWDIDIPHCFISGIDPLNYRLNRDISLDSINISDPILKLSSVRKSKLEYGGESQNIYQDIRQIVRKFSFISLEHFILSNFQVSIQNQYLQRLDEVEIERIDIGVHGFYLDYQSVQNMDKFLFSDRFSLDIENYFQSVDNGKHLIYLKRAEVSNIDNRLYFNKLKVLSLGNSLKSAINVNVEDILLKDFSMIPQLTNPALQIGLVSFNHSKLDIRKKDRQDSKKFVLEEMNLFPLVKDQLSGISIDSIEFKDLDLNIAGLKGLPDESLILKDIHLFADHLQLDSNNRVFTDDKFLYCNNVELDLAAYNMTTPNKFYEIGFQNISFSSLQKSVIIDTFSVVPLYDKKVFSSHIDFQKDRLELMIPKIEVANIGIRDFIFRQRYQAQKITLESPDIAFYKDKTIIADTTAYKSMPAKMLGALPFYLSLDTIEVKNGKLQYEELSKNFPKTGIIYFDQLNSKITNVSNDADLWKFGGALKISASAHLMSKSLVTMNSIFPLNSPNQEFVLFASLGSIEA
ncbi:MAG: hypothetical protein GQ527_12815, partial [Bacteroidales bacterium]|nr:hypothetical protein [Bacteroidales bacterium]